MHPLILLVAAAAVFVFGYEAVKTRSLIALGLALFSAAWTLHSITEVADPFRLTGF